MIMSRDQNAGRSRNIKMDNSCFEIFKFKFKYFGTAVINQISIQEEIKSRLKSHNACYHSVQNTVYKTAHLKVLLTTGCTQCHFLRRSLLILSRTAHTHTVCEVHSVPKENRSSVQATASFLCSARNFTATVLSPQQFSCQCAPSLSLVVIIVTIAVCFEVLWHYVLRDTAMASGLQYNSEGMANQQ
jgi:hypothetical protein